MWAIIDNLRQQEVMTFPDEEGWIIAERFAMQFTFWPTYQRLSNPHVSDAQAIHNGVYSIFSQVCPYLTTGREEFADLLASFYRHMSSKA